MPANFVDFKEVDKSEGTVKDKDILCSAEAPFCWPERLRTKTLEISRGITFGGRSFHQPSIRPEPRPLFFYANIPPQP